MKTDERGQQALTRSSQGSPFPPTLMLPYTLVVA